MMARRSAVAASTTRTVSGTVVHEGVAGTGLHYKHAQWVMQPKHPRALSARTSEECGLLCETTYGCTGFLFQGGATTHRCPADMLSSVNPVQDCCPSGERCLCHGDCHGNHGSTDDLPNDAHCSGGGPRIPCPATQVEDHYCWLFTFDPSTTGCAIFDPVDTSAFPEAGSSGAGGSSGVGGMCAGDCSGDELHPLDDPAFNCDAGLRCFQRDSDAHGAPGCQLPSGYSPTHDVCYNPGAVTAGVAAIRRPDACGLCKSRGLLPVVDVNRLTAQYAGNHGKDDQVGHNECWTNAYADDMQQRCRLFPMGTSWDAVYPDWSTSNRCPPARAGVHTKFYSSTQHAGMRFTVDSAHTPSTVLKGHPNVMTSAECQTACVHTHGCVAWEYDEEIVTHPTQITVETTDAYRARVQAASSLIVDDEHCTYVVDPDITESGKSAPTTGASYASRLPATSVYYSDNAVTECATRCLHTRGAFAFYVFHERCKCSNPVTDPQCTTRTSHGSTTSYSITRDTAKLGTHCQRCNPQSPYDQCAGNGVCMLSTVVNTVPGCLGDAPGLAYCVPRPLLENQCLLFSGQVPPFAAVPTADPPVFEGVHRIGVIERDHYPKHALMDDGAEHPACKCYDETDTSYSCACEDSSDARFENTLTDTPYGCSGHGRCSSLEYACICDVGYSWMWQDATTALAAGFTCAACPAGTFRDATVSTCTACPRGYYQGSTAATTCTACAAGAFTFQTKSTTNAACVSL